MNDVDCMKAILDKHDAQIVFWTPVPQEADELRIFMCEKGISYCQNVLVKTLFEDGSGGVEVSMIIPQKTENGFGPAWSMSKYAKVHNMRVTHFMTFPDPPVETRGNK